MYQLARPFFLMCETALHAGSGSDLGVIDLPIQRERHTGYPKVESSGLKGAIREAFERKLSLTINGKEINKKDNKEDHRKTINLVFGPENGGEHAAALGFTDARILLFPVKSVRGVFAWVTCPYVVEKFKEDLALCGIEPGFSVPPEHSTPLGSTVFVDDSSIVLEEYSIGMTHKDDPSCTAFAAWLADKLFPEKELYAQAKAKLARDIVVLSDEAFRDFVEMSTEVVTRTRIDPTTGTVSSRALFTEEYLPAESVLYTLTLVSPIFNKDKGPFAEGESSVLEFFRSNLPTVFQLGGNATIGKGLVRVSKSLLILKG